MNTTLWHIAVVSCCLGTNLISGNALGQDPESPEPTKTKLFRSNKYISQLVGTEFTPDQKAEGISVRYTAAVIDKDGNPIAQKGPTDADLARLHQLPKLEHLVVYGGSITEVGIRKLDNCKKLTSYEHRGMERADQLLPVLSKACPNLERLVISSSDVTEKGADAISKFRKLKRLIADDTEIASDFFHDRKFSEELTHLDLDGTNVDSTVIASLPSSATHLRLTGTKVDENAIPDLLKRKNLEWLQVPGRRFSHKQLDRLKDGMPQTDIDTGGAFSFGGF